MLKNLSLSINLLIWVNVLYAQNALDRFTAQQVNNEVLLNWTIKSGFTCNGIEILSSSDSLNFSKIGKIEGICGAVDEPISYTFSHKAPAQNKINYYRLELGGVGSTEIISVEYLHFGSDSYLVRPNPIYNEAKIYFINSKSNTHELKMYNIQGQLSNTSRTQSNFFIVEKAQLNSGMYLFTIENKSNQQVFSGKLLISN